MKNKTRAVLGVVAMVAGVLLVVTANPAGAWDDQECLDWWNEHGEIHEDCTWWEPPTTTTTSTVPEETTTTTSTTVPETTTTTEATTTTTAPDETTTTTAPDVTTTVPDPSTTVAITPDPAPVPTAQRAELPRTGASTSILTAVGASLALLGAWMVRAARRL